MSERKASRPQRGWTRGGRMLAAIAATTVALAGIGVWIVYGTSAFAVESVEVRGTTFTDEDRVREAAAIEPGTAVAAVDTADAERRVSGIASVEKATVDRDWPHGIVITISERTALLAVPEDKKFTLVDDSGVAFRTVSKQPPDTVKTIVSDPGRGDGATGAVLEVVASLTGPLKKDLVSVGATTPSRIELKLAGSRTVFWGDSSESTRKAEVATALLDRSEKHLDVSAPDVPTVS